MQLNQHVDCLKCSICSFANAIRYVRFAPAIQVVLARNILFAFFISVIPALMPVVGLKELHLQPCSLGLLFTSMGAGSVFGAVFVLPWTRQRLSSNASTVLANFLVALVYLLMAFVQQPSIFMIVAALAGIGWTLGASELWVAGQRAILGWARRRMSAIVIMASQGIRGATHGEGTCVEHAHNPAGSGTLSLYLTNRKIVIGLRYFVHVTSDAVEFEWKKSLELKTQLSV